MNVGERSEVPTELASRLVAYRRRYGITQVELARLVGTTDQSIGRWENGAAPQPRFRRRLDDLLAEESDESTPEAVLLPFPSGSQADSTYVPLTPAQLRLVERFASRMASGVPLTEDEFEAMRSFSKAAGIPWEER